MYYGKHVDLSLSDLAKKEFFDMTTYYFKQVREGYNGVRGSCAEDAVSYEASVYTVLVGFECDGEEDVLIIPERNPETDGIVTHIGYKEGLDEAHEHWTDWHHPSKGCDHIPDRYYLIESRVSVPQGIKKIVVPRTVERVSSLAFSDAEGVILEVHPDNPRLTAKDNKILPKG